MQIKDESVRAAAEAIKNGRPFRHAETARAALEAALPHLSQGAVKVKPLEWVKDGTGHWRASAITGTYHIVLSHDGKFELRLSWSLLKFDGRFDTLEAAQAAAQADYERRIMSALASHEPAPRYKQTDLSVTGEVVGLLSGTGQSILEAGESATIHHASHPQASALIPLVRQSALTACQQEAERLRGKLFKAEDRHEAEHRSHIRTGEARDKWRERAEVAEARVHELENMVNEEEANHQGTGLRLRNAESRVAELVKALADLIDHVDRNTCVHESRHRGGTIWTICDDCGKKWADDRGGFIPHVDPEPVARARAVCGRSEIQKETDHD